MDASDLSSIRAKAAIIIGDAKCRADAMRAIDILEPPAVGGNLDAMTVLGNVMERFAESASDVDGALAWYRRAALEGSERGAFEYGRLLVCVDRHGEGLPWLVRASGTGHAGAIVWAEVARAMDFSNAEQWSRAAQLFQTYSAVVAQAKVEYAWCVYRGLGVPRNVEQARRLFREIDKSGDACGAYGLGVLSYDAGDPVLDYLPLFVRAADGGLAIACGVCGEEYAYAAPPLQDRKRAAKYLARACAFGVVGAAEALGGLYLRGWGVEKNVETAFRFLLPAANAGRQHAMYLLAVAYSRGDGVPRDDAAARCWSKLAAAAGHEAAAHLLHRLDQRIGD